MTAVEKHDWEVICQRSDLVAGSGVCVLVGSEQVALFYLPGEGPELYALANRDPIGKANVLSRASWAISTANWSSPRPHKQHFSLVNGACLEEEGVRVEVYPVQPEATGC